MATVMDLDAPATSTSSSSQRRRPSWWALAVAVLAAGVLGGTVATLASGHAAVREPSIIATATGADTPRPTITAYYADGSQGDASSALSGPWTPDRPIKMLTVVATQACSITVDDVLAVSQSAAVNRFAVCLWVAPS